MVDLYLVSARARLKSFEVSKNYAMSNMNPSVSVSEGVGRVVMMPELTVERVKIWAATAIKTVI